MSGQNFGYAYVTYTKKKDAYAAIDEMDGTEIRGKIITVQFIDEEEEEEK
jgi:RNA recognition motif-containing protein